MPDARGFIPNINQAVRLDETNIPSYRPFYPEGLDLNPNSEEHKKLVNLVLGYANESANTMSARHSAWRELDKKLNVFIDLDESEKELKKKDSRKPLSIVVPHCYATKEILMTYKVAALFQTPVFKYDPSPDPTDILGTILLENSISRDVVKHRMLLDLFTMSSDDITYGFGAVMPEWKKSFGVGISGEEELIYEGNALRCIDPYNALPDPNFPIHATWDHTYFGYVERKSYLHWQQLEDRGSQGLFNIRYLQQGEFRSTYYNGGQEASGRYDKSGISHPTEGHIRPVDIIWMAVDLIPKEFKLGTSDRVETWMLGVAGDRVCVYAKKQELRHGQKPFAVNSSGMDGHNTLPISLLEVEYPIQRAIDWLWNSHITNVRKSINNMLVVDPSIVNMNDLVDSKAGLLLRLRRGAMGRGLADKAVQQLKVDDITRNNLADIGFLSNMSDRTMGLSDLARGQIEPRGERVSSREVHHANQNQLSRMEKQALLNGLQGHYTLAEQFVSNTVQFSSQERFVLLSGRWEQKLRTEYGFQGNEIWDPRDMNVNYDVIPNDGSILNSSSSDVWLQLMQTTTQHPELFQQIDFVRAWLHAARLMGVKNADQFLKTQQPQTRPDDVVDQQARQGRLAPLEEFAA